MVTNVDRKDIIAALDMEAVRREAQATLAKTEKVKSDWLKTAEYFRLAAELLLCHEQDSKP